MNCCDDICTQARNCPVRTYRLSTPAELAEMAKNDKVTRIITWAAVGVVACTTFVLVWISLNATLGETWRTFLQAAGKSGLG